MAAFLFSDNVYDRLQYLFLRYKRTAQGLVQVFYVSDNSDSSHSHSFKHGISVRNNSQSNST